MKSKHKAYEHKAAKRTNIPTDQDRVFMADEDREKVEFSPEPAGTGGPVLSWRRGSGVRGIKTDALPLYIHEKVNPSAFIEQLTRSATDGEQMNWFSEFNGLPADAKYDWYKYQGHWSNRIIRGNSVDVMASLVAKEGMSGQVQMVFFDPPYGIKFESNYQSSTRKRGQTDTPLEAASRKAFRDTYIDGLHSYMDTVFKVAVHVRALLAESGSFFLQIGTENVHRLSIVLDEVFGPENRIATIAFAKSGATSGKHLSQVADYLLWYAKDKKQVKYHQLYEPLSRKEKLEHMSSYAMVELPDGTSRNLTPEERYDPDEHLPEASRLFRRMPLTSQGESTTGRSNDSRWNGAVPRLSSACSTRRSLARRGAGEQGDSEDASATGRERECVAAGGCPAAVCLLASGGQRAGCRESGPVRQGFGDRAVARSAQRQTNQCLLPGRQPLAGPGQGGSGRSPEGKHQEDQRPQFAAAWTSGYPYRSDLHRPVHPV